MLTKLASKQTNNSRCWNRPKRSTLCQIVNYMCVQVSWWKSIGSMHQPSFGLFICKENKIWMNYQFIIMLMMMMMNIIWLEEVHGLFNVFFVSNIPTLRCLNNTIETVQLPQKYVSIFHHLLLLTIKMVSWQTVKDRFVFSFWFTILFVELTFLLNNFGFFCCSCGLS